jgi:hypothetical protein
MRIIALAAGFLLPLPALAQDMPPAQDTVATAPAAPGMTPDVTAGAEVRDMQGARVGMVEKVENGVATVATSQTKVQMPVTSFGQRDGILVITMSEAELNAAARRPPNG